MTIDIDKNIPIPIMQQKRKYPWEQMAVGDSFFIAGASVTPICNAANYASKRLGGWKFTSKTVDGGVRVWRIK